MDQQGRTRRRKTSESPFYGSDFSKLPSPRDCTKTASKRKPKNPTAPKVVVLRIENGLVGAPIASVVAIRSPSTGCSVRVGKRSRDRIRTVGLRAIPVAQRASSLAFAWPNHQKMIPTHSRIGDLMTIQEMLSEKVGRLVARNPRFGRVFEQYQIDYCCRGNVDLAEACRLADVAPEPIVNALIQVAEQPAEDETDWDAESLNELADHIEQTHHVYLRNELPRLTELIDKVCRAHGERKPELFELRDVFASMRAELESHMMKEEQILFPSVRALEHQGGPLQFPFGSIANPIRMMEHEHDTAGNALREMRRLTNDWTPPKDACPTYRVMLESLAELEQDLHIHIHKENNILFPRAQVLESTTG